MSPITIPNADPPLAPLPADYTPDWDALRMVLLRQGMPDWVPFFEQGLDRSHKRRVLGRPIRSLADDLEVSKRVGLPTITVSLGLHGTPAVLANMDTTHIEDQFDLDREGELGWIHGQERRWAHGHALQNEAEFEAFPWPDPDELDYSVLDEADRLLPANYRLVCAIGKVFNLAWWMMGFDAFSYALADQPELIDRIYEKIIAYQTRVVERVLDHRCVGMIWHADDLAYRTGLMVSPRLLRKHIFPAYTRMNTICHERDVVCGFHSDGDISAVLEDVIAAGFDTLNPIEPIAMDIRQVQKQVGGRIALIGNVDLHYTLTLGTPAEVEEEVRGLLRDLAPAGGYALASANSVPEYVPWYNFVAMHSAWITYGRYPIQA